MLGGPDGVRDRASLDIGCVRLSERLLHADPPTPAEVDAVRAEAAAALPARLTGAATELVGVAGTVTTLATIDMGLECEIPEVIDGHELPADAVERLLGELAGMPLERRRLVRGLMPERAATIVAGSAILAAIVAATRAEVWWCPSATSCTAPSWPQRITTQRSVSRHERSVSSDQAARVLRISPHRRQYMTTNHCGPTCGICEAAAKS